MDMLITKLQNMNLDSSYNGNSSLKELLKLIFPFTDVAQKPTRKADIIVILYAFYTDPESAARLYDRLSKYEKALLHCIVQSKYKPLEEDFAALAKAHNFMPEKPKYSYYSSSSKTKDKYFPKNTLLEEIKNYRGMDALTEGRLAPVLVLNPGAEKKAKTIVENNKRFCKLEG